MSQQLERSITLDQLNSIAELADGEVREDYSGRGMFGETCIGIVATNEFMVGVAAGEILGHEQAMKLAKATRTESMGRDSIIIYWPRWKIQDDNPKAFSYTPEVMAR